MFRNNVSLLKKSRNADKVILVIIFSFYCEIEERYEQTILGSLLRMTDEKKIIKILKSNKIISLNCSV